MKKFILLMTFLSFNLYSQELELPSLKNNNSFSKAYRVLNTTISDKSFFQEYYNDTNLTLDSVIRYYFNTSIKLKSDQNQLISMDGTKFNLSSKNAKDLTDEIISLISKMFVGKREFLEFKKLNKKTDQLN